MRSRKRSPKCSMDETIALTCTRSMPTTIDGAALPESIRQAWCTHRAASSPPARVTRLRSSSQRARHRATPVADHDTLWGRPLEPSLAGSALSWHGGCTAVSRIVLRLVRRPSPRRAASGAGRRGNVKSVEASYRLAPVQHGMLFHWLRDGAHTGVDVEQMIVTLREEVDADALRCAWVRVTGRHPVLRTRFRWSGLDEPVQEVIAD